MQDREKYMGEDATSFEEGERVVHFFAGKNNAGEITDIEAGNGLWMIYDDDPTSEEFVAYEDKPVMWREGKGDVLNVLNG